jgi:hypothetical protein
MAGYRRDDVIAPASQECMGTDGFPPRDARFGGRRRSEMTMCNKNIGAEIAPI